MRDRLLEKALQQGVPPQGTVQVYALSLWKCFGQPYLVRSLDDDQKATAYLHNYQALLRLCKTSGLRRLCEDDLYLWRGKDYLVSLKAEHVITNEGELTLHFRRGGEALYAITFTFVPGDMVGLADHTVILLSRMQGVGGRGDAVRQATKECGDITPQRILYCALVAIARAIGLNCIVGVAAHNQLCSAQDSPASFVQAYDEFYATVRGRALSPGFFRLPVEQGNPSLWAIVSSNPRRTRLKRKAKEAIMGAVEDSWNEFVSQHSA